MLRQLRTGRFPIECIPRFARTYSARLWDRGKLAWEHWQAGPGDARSVVAFASPY